MLKYLYSLYIENYFSSQRLLLIIYLHKLQLYSIILDFVVVVVDVDDNDDVLLIFVRNGYPKYIVHTTRSSKGEKSFLQQVTKRSPFFLHTTGTRRARVL